MRQKRITEIAELVGNAIVRSLDSERRMPIVHPEVARGLVELAAAVRALSSRVETIEYRMPERGKLKATKKRGRK